MVDYQGRNFWGYLDESLKELIRQSQALIEEEEKRLTSGGKTYHDYAFIVFPAAKAYEGFLKKLFLDMRLIGSQQFYSDHFRIGRALSPSLPKRYRAGWVYGKLIRDCGGEDLPAAMWEVWKKGRNRTFHYFPHHQECTNFGEAKKLVEEIVEMMEKVLEGCRLSKRVDRT